ncbi:uncharacterized protein BDZ99DRAFT_543847 [Mytilinidion resinicola]|uniref:Uncharacterized protein n=1 Tax=Mytilinidion resinicola TaxID=574789 RepID=A0A6A6Y8M7_9PEZI|nr:uncharacterized protein BDZ99DRAFT_543847 [Mytilinidion resinicola]KAF2804913.1 hypothetical protein BDZ99DRAFT_543847 [Mytilinidion resinicola]
MLPPNTSLPGRSIWDGLGRETFERHVHALSRTGTVPDPVVLKEEDWPKSSHWDILPFAVEKQLADDLAFIAACEYGVGYVTAATAAPATGEAGMTVRLAANEGVCDSVERAMQAVFRILERCAGKSISRECCAEAIFDAVVNLNFNRIQGRLASRFFRPPPHKRGTPRKPLADRVRGHIASSKPIKRLSETSKDFATLFTQANAFHASFVQLESSKDADKTEATKTVIRQAFLLTVDGVSLPSRLKRIGYPASMVDTRDVRGVNKVANYWRICNSLAHFSRFYRTLFRKLHLERLEAYQPLCTPLKKFVHAKVQMVVLYETSLLSTWPRVIGASKEACFLCNSFIKSHGSFYMLKAHRQIFP